jgi:hypothetical protein
VKAVFPLVFLASFAGAYGLSGVLDRRPVEWDRKQELAVWSGESVSRMFAGYANVMADIYWLRSIQYHGGEVAFNPESKLDLLESYLDITTTLDPRFEIAYRYGAIFLAEGRYGANNPAGAIRLLDKGRRAMPRNWQLAQDRAMFTSFYLKDGAEASRIAIEASAIPGAPRSLKVMAATFLAENGSRATAKRIWLSLAGPNEEPFVRAAAKRYLDRLNAVDLAEELTAKLVPRYLESTGSAPASIDDFLRARLLVAVPRDPVGTPLVFDPESRRFRVSPRSSLYLSDL